MARFKKIAVLTSGGDAPGMNAVIRAIVRCAEDAGVDVCAIYEGYEGLLKGNIKDLTQRDVSNIIQRGGTMLYSARCLDFKEEWAMQKAIETCKAEGIEGIVAIGGDGTFKGARDLCQRGMPCIGVPGTIDNDITATEYTIGCDTALNTSVEMIDKLRDTCDSHRRCSVVEVMGRSTVYLPLQIGIAVGASAILVPGYDYDFDKIAERIKAQAESGKRNFVVIVSEGLKGVGQALAEHIEKYAGVESRYTQLGHVVRGGSPTVKDRVTASQMAAKAVELLLAGESNKVICQHSDRIDVYPIDYALDMDALYRGKKTAEDYKDKYSEEEISAMLDYCAKRNAWLKEFYDLNEALTK